MVLALVSKVPFCNSLQSALIIMGVPSAGSPALPVTDATAQRTRTYVIIRSARTRLLLVRGGKFSSKDQGQPASFSEEQLQASLKHG
jgi:hypothetical protein